MTHRRMIAVLVVATVIAGCATPYRPPVITSGGTPFQGIAGLLEGGGNGPVDVLLVHGMCTHTRDDASREIDALLVALQAEILRETAMTATLPVEVDGIEIETRSATVGPGTVRLTALIWSPLTVPLKRQLDYDDTGVPTDCAAGGECKPRRAALNGALKDTLLNDCLADALIYEGASKSTIRQAMANAMARVLNGSHAQSRMSGLAPGPIVLVTDSLGSKISFDALEQLLDPGEPPGHGRVAKVLLDRLTIVFMRANQLPILGLADQSIGQRALGSGLTRPGQDSLQRLLIRKAARPARAVAPRPVPADAAQPQLTLVAFTDPNDLLSYRLLPSRYAVPGIDVADVLVSNDTTFFSLFERPDRAHLEYRSNPDVVRLIACGSVGSPLCR